MMLKPISARALTLGYVIALLVIAGLSTASHFLLEYNLQTNEGSAAIINQTGRQRMLSQRIAGLAAEYRLGDASARVELLSAIREFETSHDALVLASRLTPMRESSARELSDLYFGGATALDAQVRSFVADARRIADLDPDDRAMALPLSRVLAAARAPLLAGLERVVRIEQRESEQRIIRLEQFQWTILAIVLSTLFAEALAIFRPMIRRIVSYTSELVSLATTDPLTGAANRRSFMERCEAEIARARRYARPASLLMLDIDHFKSINDAYGHAAGDAVLKALGQLLSETLRQIDIWGRLGGEEFAVVLAETALPSAALVAERMRERVAETRVPYGEGSITFTVSVGVASLLTDTGGLDQALQVADTLMYQAKQTGRNRVVVDSASGAKRCDMAPDAPNDLTQSSPKIP